MTRKLSLILAAVLLSTVLLSSAMADIITFDGTVAVKDTVEVYAPIGGTVETVPFQAGQAVKAGDTLVTLKTTKVYATQDGTVTGIFGRVGDSADTVTSKYGAVMYIEGNSKFTLSATTDTAYNSTETKMIHIGETVYLFSRSNAAHTGSGVVTAVSGTGYTVEVRKGTFEHGESCDIFRDAKQTTKLRIGRGTTSRTAPEAVSATGSIVRYAVKNGATVKRGDLLLETLTGSFDGLYMSGTSITATVDGVLGSVSAAVGGAVNKDSVTAVIYPTGSMRIEGNVAEADLAYIHVGDAVEIEMNWDPDNSNRVQGTVSMISALANTDASGNTTYTVYVDFTPDTNTRYGMTCSVSTIETVDPAAVEPETETEADEAEATEEAEEQDASAPQFPGQLPEGFTGEMPEGGFPGFPQEGVTDNGGNQ